nr:diguanylate cyclase [Methylomarinum sp. Ch1-1]MDP4519575.1 diguanylate cyclase [Methylomarinum sp. Ch1-1]
MEPQKNGEVYPVWQNITAVRDNNGQISHFVSVFSNISDKKAQEMEIQALAYYDTLTKLPNRRLLLNRMEQELKAARRHGLFGAIIFLDLDDFKLLNDSAGHLVGDELLIKVAERIGLHLRTEDTPARLGGDEFLVLLQANQDSVEQASEQAMLIAERMQQELNKPYILNGVPMHFTPSIGISLYPEGNANASELIQQADTAMYRSKSRGKNSISFFNKNMQRAADHRIKIESQLRTAFQQNQFELYFQPQLCADGRCEGVEALILLASSATRPVGAISVYRHCRTKRSDRDDRSVGDESCLSAA